MSAPYRGLDENILFEVRTVIEVLAHGLHPSLKKGEGIAYVGGRDFEEGDPFQHIDIPRSLEKSPRFDDLVLRLFEPERQLKVIIVVDATRGMEIPIEKRRITRALLWIATLASLQRHDNVTVLVVFDKKEGGICQSPTIRSAEDLNLFIGMLLANHLPEVAGDTVRDVLGEIIPDDTAVFVISDFLRDAFMPETLVSRIPPKRNGCLILAMLDEWEDKTLLPSLMTAFDPTTGGSRRFDGRAGRDLDAIRAAAHERQTRIAQAARHAGHVVARIPIFRPRPFDELVRALVENTEQQILP